MGDTIARETFVTQFVFDVARAANVSSSRVLVLEIAPGRVHYDWEVRSPPCNAVATALPP